MAWLSNIVGRLGLGVDPNTGERVRTRPVPADDWGNTYRVIEKKNEVTGEWERTGDVPGSTSGGHY